ncbi:hypothetical protein DM02DRAFT_700272, partial [Periconia macrospinosa]
RVSGALVPSPHLSLPNEEQVYTAVPGLNSPTSGVGNFQANQFKLGDHDEMDSRNVTGSNRSAKKASPLPVSEIGLPAQPQRLPPRVENNEKRCDTTGCHGTQGKRKPRNTEGRVECSVCREHYGKKHDYKSTGGLRKHQIKFHENKLSDADKERGEPFKHPKPGMKKAKDMYQNMDKDLEKAGKDAEEGQSEHLWVAHLSAKDFVRIDSNARVRLELRVEVE